MKTQNSGDAASPSVVHPHIDDQRLQLATRAAGIGVWEWRIGTDEMFYDEQARKISGFGASGPVTLDMVRSVTYPDDLIETQKQSQRAFDPDLREDRPYEYRIITADTGEMRWVEAHGEAVFDTVDGETRAVTYVGTLQDITASKVTQDTILESEARLRLAMEAGDLAVWELDTAKGTIAPSPELNRIMGLPEDSEPTPEQLRDLYAPGEQERLDKIGAEARERGDTKMKTEMKIIWPNGSEHWILLNAQIAPTALGTGNRVIGTMLDITDRKNTEQQMSILAQEMRHRVKNTMSVVQAITNQAMRRSNVADARAELSGRLQALAASTDLMFAHSEPGTELTSLIADIAAPFRSDTNDPFEIEGPSVVLPEKSVASLGLLIHEMCTNASKYGALSEAGGKVAITWTCVDDTLNLNWQESGGPAVAEPEDLGFGSKLIKNLALSLNGSSRTDYAGDGLNMSLSLPL